MSTEEMRTELEIFVNEGLREGWRGWPLKSEVQRDRSRRSRSRVTSLRFWRNDRSKLARLLGRLGPFAISA